MKKAVAYLVAAFGCLWAIAVAQGQGTFGNLDFEAAKVAPLPTGQYGDVNGTPSTDGVPAWSVYYGSVQSQVMTHNNFTLGSANVAILGPNWDTSFGIPIIQGNFSVMLQAGTSPGPVSTSIAQTGEIAATAKSIQMRINPFSRNVLGVTIGGQNVPMYVLSQNAFNDWLVGGDVSAFAGQTQELRISALTFPDFRFGQIVLDGIVFSGNVVPEPSTAVLIACGLAGLGLYRWRPR